jgi:predicted nucleotidyltransferase
MTLRSIAAQHTITVAPETLVQKPPGIRRDARRDGLAHAGGRGMIAPGMNTDLSHLPDDKRDEIRRVVETIREAVDPEMIILFGSHARGDWVEDRYEKDGVVYEYRSDYDILVIVRPKHEEGGSNRLYQRVEREIREVLPPGSPVNAIAHNLDHVNTKLTQGQYFFTDITKEGILLYESGRYDLAKPRELS